MKKTLAAIVLCSALIAMPAAAQQPVPDPAPETQQATIENIIGNKPMIIDLETIRELDKHNLSLKGIVVACMPTENFAKAKEKGLLLYLGGGRNADALKFSMWIDTSNKIVISVKHDVGTEDQIKDECVISVFDSGDWKSEKIE